MRSLLNVLLIFIIILFANSCDNEILNTEIVNPETIDHSKDFLKELRIERADRSSVDFIRGEFDGKLIYFTTISNAYYYDNSAWSCYFLNSNGLDQINLIRQTSTDSVQLSIFISQSKIFTRQFPYNLKDGGLAEIQLINLKKLYKVVKGSSDDDSTFLGTTFDSLTLQVTNFVDNTIEGKFEGSLKSYSGSNIIVKNGRFRIKVKVDKS
jgi:hypothetical protein